MKSNAMSLLIILLMTTSTFAQDDKYLWLEEVENPKALEWVEGWNKKSLETIKGQPGYQSVYNKNLEIYNSTDRIADPAIFGEFVYNFWQDKTNPRGIWRRIPLKSYTDGLSNWETLIDLDKLSEKDDIKWVFKGAIGLYPKYEKFLVSLSKGGGDAVIVKEFDASTKAFIENGFYLPEAKGGASWIDENTLMVSTDFGAGITTSGYPKQVKIWKRGTGLKDANLVFEGAETDMGVWGITSQTEKKTYQMISQRTSFYSGNNYVIEKGKLIKLNLPDDIDLSAILNEQVILQLKSDWEVNGKTFKQGSVVSVDYNDLIAGKMNLSLIVTPDERSSVTAIAQTKNVLLVYMLNNVKSELYKFTFDKNGKKKKLMHPNWATLPRVQPTKTATNISSILLIFLNHRLCIMAMLQPAKQKK